MVGNGMNLNFSAWFPPRRGLRRKPCRQSPRLCPEPQAGFTLIELLLVIVVMAILGTIIMGSAAYVNKVARTKRTEVTCRVLETALVRYRSDHGKWPIGTFKPNADGYVIVKGKDNAKIFGPLREENQPRERRIRYLDESTLYTLDKKDRPVRLDKTSGEQALVYMTRESAKTRYFTVTINVEADTAKVDAPEKNN